MFRSAAIGAAIAILAFAAIVPAPSRAAVDDPLPPVGTITRTYTRPGNNRPAVLSGVLTGTQDGSPVIIARNYLAGHPSPLGAVPPTSMRLERVRFHRDGAAVKFQQTHGGLDVIGGTLAVRIDGGGRVRWVSSGVTPIPASFDVTPSISGAAAAALVGGGEARLVILGDPVFDVARLAYEVTLPRDLLRLHAYRGWVDAKSGEVIAIVDRARRADPPEAHVYRWNPAVSPLEVVTLTDLPLGATALAGGDIDALSCVDLRSCRDLVLDGETASYHVCEPISMAMSDGNGSFLDISRPSIDSNPVDAFAEVQLYFHATQAMAAFRQFAEDGGFALTSRPIKALANFRLPGSIPGARCIGVDAPPTSQLAPFDDGLFLPAGAGDGGEDWLILGQGASADMAYDGDLVFHEVGHAVMAEVSPLADRVYDPYGTDPGPAALHEGYADYFAAAISGDPDLAEYAGAAHGSPDPTGAIRSAENDSTCPADLSGVPHHDGQIWLGALWDLRQGYAIEDRLQVDAAVFAAMDMLGAADTMGVAQAMTAAEIELTFGLPAGATAAAGFRLRGLDGCRERSANVELGQVTPLQRIGGVTTAGGQEPAPVQFVVRLPEAAQELRLDFSEVEIVARPGDPATLELAMLVKPGSDPIAWSWTDGVAHEDAEHEGHVPTPIDGPGSGSLQADFPAGVYRVQLVNRGSAQVTLHDLTFSASASPAEPDAGIVIPPPGTGPGGGTDEPIGCGCNTGGGDRCVTCSPWGRAAGLLALMMVAFLVLRRRGP